jgi:hypothetical protein
LVNGIIVGGFGLGAFIFNQIQTAYLNPANGELDSDHYFKVWQKFAALLPTANRGQC